MKRNDILLMLALVAAGFAALLFTRVGKSAATAEVYLKGALVWQCPLSEDGTYEVSGVYVAVKDGTARVTKADCPDQLCVRMGTISRAGESIVCLPNQVSVVLTGDDALDAVLN